MEGGGRKKRKTTRGKLIIRKITMKGSREIRIK